MKRFGFLLEFLLFGTALAQGNLISNVRQLTFAGERSGEGYFNTAGNLMIFQSEREPGNPFFQIYLMNLETGSVRRLSPGRGRATCSWLHPNGKWALFSSTHEDPRAEEKQREEIEKRTREPAARHKWDYDEAYEIYQVDLESGQLVNLTRSLGYDAEASYSPDGKKILFASNRRLYTGELSEPQQHQGWEHPELALDLYQMNADGSGVERLTDAWGQDGGPFYSPDGRSIVWRRFSEDGLRSEIYWMDLAERKERRLTDFGAMSWAPFFHPSGRYVIFSTNLHGMDNFELYLVDVEGRSRPVRVTEMEGFDGLPVFTPDGNHLAWTSNRTSNRKGQIFIAEWNHRRALELLGLEGEANSTEAQAEPDRPAASLKKDVEFLASPGMGGRLCGTEQEKRAARYLAGRMKELGLAPAGKDGYFQEFTFVKGSRPDRSSQLLMIHRGKKQQARLNVDWRPLDNSSNGNFGPAKLVFVGFGLVSPAGEGLPALDAYRNLDVSGKWVLMFSDLPGGLEQNQRVFLSPYADSGRKIAEAKARGALGVILCNAPGQRHKKQLVEFGGGQQDAGLAVLALAAPLIEKVLEVKLDQLEKDFSGPQPREGFEVELELSARIKLKRITGRGLNVLGMLPGKDQNASPLVIGAHYDHIGRGEGMGSLAKPQERGRVHPGADDNASGVAVMLELARRLIAEGPPQRPVIFAAWSGEELGLLGSGYFIRNLGDRRPYAYLNLDMVGQLREKLLLYGFSSSPLWAELVEEAAAPVGLALTVQQESVLPTDATSFVLAGVPSLSAFTGLHDRYNTPRDTADSLNYQGMELIARFFSRLAARLAHRQEPLPFQEPVATSKEQQPIGRHRLRAYLGTVPDFAATDVRGVKISGVKTGSPAEKAGLRAGDILRELAGQKLDNLHDYARVLDALEAGKPAQLKLERAGELLQVEVVPEVRE